MAELKPLNVNGKQVDLQRCVPITVGDWKALRKDTGLDPERIVTADDAAKFLWWMFRRANPEIDENDVATIPGRRFWQIVAFLFDLDKKAQEEAKDYDFLPPLTRLQGSTDGLSQTSNS